ncbi:MAG TPA: TetR/AcrR family transcriptional regulator [Micropepsaceae bacterium]|nr:TetR/AcrR family transcriptional regulator [Micropepsaceae bacterium]
METKAQTRPQRLTRAEQQAQTRERLLAAAERVFARHGYEGASIDLISAEAGYSKGAIYSNFESKEAIFLALTGLYMARSMADLEKALDVAPDQLADALNQWLTNFQTDNDCLLLVTELQLQARRNPTFAASYYRLQEEQTRTLANNLKRYCKASGTAMPVNAMDLAGALIAITHGLALQRPQSDIGTPGRVIRAMMKLLTRP